MITREPAIMLAIAAAITCVFSLFNRPSIRGLRNLGILATYALGIFSAFRFGLMAAIATWALFGFGSGFLYYLYERWAISRSDEDEATLSLSTVVHGLLAWPVMLPEVVEYSLAELGFLGGSGSTPADDDTSHDPNAA